jgi:SHS2 domain-containing protein
LRPGNAPDDPTGSGQAEQLTPVTSPGHLLGALSAPNHFNVSPRAVVPHPSLSALPFSVPPRDRSAVTGAQQRQAPQEPGHRVVPHTADCVIEAWAPDPVRCIGEALRALVEEFAEVRDEPSSRTLPLAATKGAGEDALVQLLEEVIYVVDVFSVVPIRFHLADTEDGGVAGDMEVVSASRAEIVGPLPKGVSYHNLSMNSDDGSWRCHVLIDV